MHALADESGRLATDLHRVLSDIDPARWHVGAADAMRHRLDDLRARAAALAVAHWPEREARLPASLDELHRRLAEAPDPDSTMATGEARWMAFKSSLVPAYEALGSALSAYEIHVPSLRPTNYRRNVTHVFFAFSCVLILWVLPSPEWAMALAVPAAAIGWTMEIARRRSARVNAALMRVLAPIAHPHEHRRVNSATWYTTALALLAIMETPLAAGIGLAVLGLGDPAAALIGRRYGRHVLRHGRTLEGTTAFVVAGFIGGLGAALLFAPDLGLGTLALLSLAGALTGALAELLSLRIDDNLSVPLAAAGGVLAASMALGLG